MGQKAKDYDDILERYVGGGGRWQWKKLMWLFPVHVSCGLPLLLHMFSAYTPPHRCEIETCDSPTVTDFHPDFLNFTTPRDHASSTFLRDAEDFDPCMQFAYKPGKSEDGRCIPSHFDHKHKVNCSSYVYDRSEFHETLTTKLDLVCDKVYQRHALGSVMMLGLMTGSLLGKLYFLLS